ncbi:MAG: hypothetical protein HY235_21240, partial [Acidobacteria bacterium]|nr:hypothetical protein [Acidobacteriota bacterium]
SWTWIASLGTGRYPQSQITGFVIDPLSPGTLFASNTEGVYKSDNGGVSWREAVSGLTDRRIISLAIDSRNPEKLYAGTGNSRPRNILDGSGMFYSVNGGDSWSAVRGLPAAPVPAIAVSPLRPDVIYAALMNAGVYKSVDGAASWTLLNTGLQSLCVYTLAMNPENPDVLYAGTNSSYCASQSGKPDHVYKTEDGGSNWKVVLQGENRLDNIEAIAVDPSNPSNVYVTNHTEKVWFSPDAGGAWRLANKGVIRHGAHLYLWAIAPDSSGSTFYLITCGRGVLRNDVKAPEKSSTPATASSPRSARL